MIPPKKSLGQNFLRSQKALSQIIDAGEIRGGKNGDTILEIGPGEGALTERILAKKPLMLLAVEKDDRLIPILEEKFKKYYSEKSVEKLERKNKISIIHGDILDLLKEPAAKTLTLAGLKKPYKVIANIPYYITGAVIRRLFEMPVLPEKIVLLVQKEVAERIVAANKKESLLSLSVKLYGVPKKVSNVPCGAFVPAPNVDSAIISIENIKRKISLKKEELFFEIIKAAFSHKRKRLARNLDKVAGRGHVEWEKIIVNAGFSKDARAEDLSVDNFLSFLS